MWVKMSTGSVYHRPRGTTDKLSLCGVKLTGKQDYAGRKLPTGAVMCKRCAPQPGERRRSREWTPDSDYREAEARRRERQAERTRVVRGGLTERKRLRH